MYLRSPLYSPLYLSLYALGGDRYFRIFSRVNPKYCSEIWDLAKSWVLLRKSNNFHRPQISAFSPKGITCVQEINSAPVRFQIKLHDSSHFLKSFKGTLQGEMTPDDTTHLQIVLQHDLFKNSAQIHEKVGWPSNDPVSKTTSMFVFSIASNVFSAQVLRPWKTLSPQVAFHVEDASLRSPQTRFVWIT